MTTVLLPRPAGSDTDAGLLEQAGVVVVADPYIATTPLLDAESMAARRRLAAELPAAALVVTSVRALGSLIDYCDVDRASTVFAIGPASAAAARAAGFTDVLVPSDGADNVALVRLIAHHRPVAVAIPRSTVAPAGFTNDLEALGIDVHQVHIYSTSTVDVRPASADALAAGAFDAVIVRSGSAARALAQFVPRWPSTTAAVAGGRPSSLVLRELGIPVAAISGSPDAATVVATTLELLGLKGVK